MEPPSYSLVLLVSSVVVTSEIVGNGGDSCVLLLVKFYLVSEFTFDFDIVMIL